MSTNEMTFAARAIAVAKELPAYDHLPKVRAMSAYHDAVELYLDSGYQTWEGVEKLSMWAYAFDAEVAVSLSWLGSSGDVTTKFVLGGSTVRIAESISSAQAYALGALLQKPLSRDTPLTLAAGKLQELLPKLAEVAA